MKKRLALLAMATACIAGRAQINNPTTSFPFTQVPVEKYGAVGDGVTNDAAALQACLNGIAAPGQCVLQAKTYFIGTNTLSITRSGVGILGQNGAAVNAGFYPSPVRSDILSSSATADIIDCFGTNATNTLYGNKFQYFAMSRNVVPNGIVNGPPVSGPVGLNIKYSYGAIVDRVVSEDSAAGFLLHGVGSGGVGYINNSIATWGLNGVTESVGSYVGFYVDSQNGEASPSLRMTNDNVANNLGAGVNTLGYFLYGTALNDFMGWNLETSNVSYGDFVQETGVTGIGGQDIHFRNSINDNCFATCVYINGLVSASLSTVDVDGGWAEGGGGGNPTIHIIGSNNVTVRGVQIANPATYAILADTTSSNVALRGNTIITANNGISLVGGSDYTVTGNLLHSSGAGTLLSMTSSPAHVATGGNVYSGTGTGVSIAAGTSDVKGLESETFDNGLTITSAIPFLTAPIGSETVTFSATPTFSNITRSSTITLTAAITSFTLAAGIDGQQKTIIFCENGTGGFTVTSPANVRGLTVGTTASKCTTANLAYSAGQSAWMTTGEVQNQ